MLVAAYCTISIFVCQLNLVMGRFQVLVFIKSMQAMELIVRPSTFRFKESKIKLKYRHVRHVDLGCETRDVMENCRDGNQVKSSKSRTLFNTIAFATPTGICYIVVTISLLTLSKSHANANSIKVRVSFRRGTSSHLNGFMKLQFVR